MAKGPKARQPGQCEHELCECTTAPGERYCSPYCLKAADVHTSSALLGETPKDLPCECGHPACV
jgi:hypothetical protein